MPTLVVRGGSLAGWRLDVDRPITVGRTHADVRIEDPQHAVRCLLRRRRERDGAPRPRSAAAPARAA